MTQRLVFLALFFFMASTVLAGYDYDDDFDKRIEGKIDFQGAQFNAHFKTTQAKLDKCLQKQDEMLDMIKKLQGSLEQMREFFRELIEDNRIPDDFKVMISSGFAGINKTIKMKFGVSFKMHRLLINLGCVFICLVAIHLHIFYLEVCKGRHNFAALMSLQRKFMLVGTPAGLFMLLLVLDLQVQFPTFTEMFLHNTGTFALNAVMNSTAGHFGDVKADFSNIFSRAFEAGQEPDETAGDSVFYTFAGIITFSTIVACLAAIWHQTKVLYGLETREIEKERKLRCSSENLPVTAGKGFVSTLFARLFPQILIPILLLNLLFSLFSFGAVWKTKEEEIVLEMYEAGIGKIDMDDFRAFVEQRKNKHQANQAAKEQTPGLIVA